MIGETRFSLDQATSEQIAHHLHLCDASFVPPLSGRVQIADYAVKLASHAARFEAWQNSDLVGLIAVYCGDREKGAAYISNVSVLAEVQQHGIGALLLGKCLDFLKERGFAYVELQVDSRSYGAIRLYRRFGFTALGSEGHATFMNLKWATRGANEQK